MAAEWKFRPNTMDRMIFNDVVLFNEYQLPSRFAADDIVLDIGAHIGAFAYAALERGCQQVYAVEADGANVELAAENLRDEIAKGYVQLMRGAVWRSDANSDQLYFDGYHPFPASYVGMEGILNTGNGSVLWGSGEAVEKLAFDDLIDRVTQHQRRRVRLLKLDCEGAEWPILLTSKRLHLIEEICGEFHELGGEYLEISEDRPLREPIFRAPDSLPLIIDTLVMVLRAAGFGVTYRRHRRPNGALEGLGFFFASRSAEAPSATASRAS